MLKTSNKERVFCPSNALNIAKQELRNLGLISTEYVVGKGDIKTVQIISEDEHGFRIDHSCGKGIAQQSYASAYFEALEHIWDSTYCVSKPGMSFVERDYKLFSPHHIPSVETHIDERAIQNLLEKNHSGKMACIPLHSYIDHSIVTYYPIALCMPDYINMRLPGDDFTYGDEIRYSTNSGTATGLSFEEAAIHSLLEIVERDAQSCFILDMFFRNGKVRQRRVNKETLPDNIKYIVNTIEAEMEDILEIVDITNEFQIPTYFASGTIKKESFVSPIGYGCSLSPEYAIERAILEVLQQYHTAQFLGGDDSDFKPHHQRFTQLNMPRFASAVISDLNIINKRIGNNLIDLDITCEIPDSLGNYLNLIIEKINKISGAPLYFINKKSESGIISVKSYIVGAEKFFISTAGHMIVPGGVGARRLKGIYRK